MASAIGAQVRHRPDAPQGARVLHRPDARARGRQRRHLRRALADAAGDGPRDRRQRASPTSPLTMKPLRAQRRAAATPWRGCPTSRRVAADERVLHAASTSARAGRRRVIIGVPRLRAPAHRRRHRRVRLGTGRRHRPDRHAERRARTSSPAPRRRYASSRPTAASRRCASAARAATSAAARSSPSGDFAIVLRDARDASPRSAARPATRSLALRLRDTEPRRPQSAPSRPSRDAAALGEGLHRLRGLSRDPQARRAIRARRSSSRSRAS